jgi:hypothetical protein
MVSTMSGFAHPQTPHPSKPQLPDACAVCLSPSGLPVLALVLPHTHDCVTFLSIPSMIYSSVLPYPHSVNPPLILSPPLSYLPINNLPFMSTTLFLFFILSLPLWTQDTTAPTTPSHSVHMCSLCTPFPYPTQVNRVCALVCVQDHLGIK